MKLNLVSVEQVKAFLGITVATYDDAINFMIPVVSSDVRRILNTQFNKIYAASFDNTEDVVTSFAELDMGTILVSENLPEGTYITGKNQSGQYTISETPTDEGDYINPTITIAQLQTIAKMIWYRIDNQNTNVGDDSRVASKSYGPVSISYNTSTEINTKWNYPQNLLNDLGVAYANVG